MIPVSIESYPNIKCNHNPTFKGFDSGNIRP